jgi:Uncharacterised nucleotidyltransferase
MKPISLRAQILGAVAVRPSGD